MNTLLKGLIVTLASVFGFALIAAGVSVGLAPSSDTSPVKHDKVLVKREDSAPVAAVVEDDDNSPDDNNGFDPSTRNRAQHGSGGQARAQAFDDHGGLRPAGQSDDVNDMATAGTNTNTGTGVGTNTGTGGVNVGQSANGRGELEPGDDHGHGVELGDDNGGGSGSSGSGSSGSGSSGGGGDDGINHDLNDD